MLRDELARKIATALDRLIESGRLPKAEYPKVEISDTKSPEHGDFACNFALNAAKAAQMNPREVGELIAEGLRSDDDLEKVAVAGPGFINLTLSSRLTAVAVQNVLDKPEQFYKLSPSRPLKINVEFVSVNPNGPITVGSGRGAAYGSALCNVLEAAGHTVHREFYINDGVNSEQMRLFALSVKALLEGKEIPNKGYSADYVSAVARLIPLRLPESARRSLAQIGFVQLYRFHHDPDNVDPLGDRAAAEPIVGSDPRWPFRLEDRDEGGFRFILSYEKFLALNPPGSWQSKAARLNEKSVSRQIHGFVQLQSEFDEEWFNEQRYRLQLLAATKAFILNEEWPIEADVDKWILKSAKNWANLIGGGKLSSSFEKTERRLLGELMSETTPVSSFASEFLRKYGEEALLLPANEFKLHCQDLMIELQTDDLAAFGVEFDTWFSEQSLHDAGKVEELIDRLVEKGVADDQPVRTIIEYGKKGEIKEIVKEDQPVDEDTGEGQESDVSREPGEAKSPETATLWLRSTKFGDPQDRVLRRKDGRLTYIASDVAYHHSKFDRPEGADKLITVLGPDHHGYIGRLQAVVAALLEQPSPAASEEFTDDDAKIWKDASEKQDCINALEEAKNRLEVLIFQLVRFVKDGKPAPMRKRDGNIFALIDLINEIGEKVQPNGSDEEKQTAGRDVARFFYLMRNHDTTFDFDLDLAAKQSEENPVFYAQYAHARICSVIGKAAEAGLRVEGQGSCELELLSHPKEKALILKLQDLGYEVERCSEDYTVSRLTTYAVELARTYHHFYEACRVIQEEEPELSKARLALCHATSHALKATFGLLGISAPERM